MPVSIPRVHAKYVQTAKSQIRQSGCAFAFALTIHIYRTIHASKRLVIRLKAFVLKIQIRHMQLCCKIFCFQPQHLMNLSVTCCNLIEITETNRLISCFKTAF